MEEKKKREMQRDQHIHQVKHQMEKIENQRRRRILTQMNAKENHLEEIKKEREKSLSQKREENLKKEMEKKRNVEKILKQQEKERQNTLKRLEHKSQQIQQLQQEKNSNKWQIEKQKIVEEFEKMKKTGRINHKKLLKMGVSLPDKKSLKEQLKNRHSQSSLGSTQNMSSSKSTLSKTGNNRHSQKAFHTVESPQKSSKIDPIQNVKTHSPKEEFKNHNKATFSNPKPAQTKPKVVEKKPRVTETKPKGKPTPYETNNNPMKLKKKIEK